MEIKIEKEKNIPYLQFHLYNIAIYNFKLKFASHDYLNAYFNYKKSFENTIIIIYFEIINQKFVFIENGI